MARNFTLPKLVNKHGQAIGRAWCRAYRADTHALVEEQYTDDNGDATFTALPDTVDCYIIATWSREARWFLSEAPPALGDLSGDLDDIDDGTTYGKVKVDDLISNRIAYDKLQDGTTYKRVLSTDLSSGHLKLTSNTVVSGEWYDESGVEIDATHGINIYGKDNALTTRATKTGTIQCYVGSDGKIYAGAGKVQLSSTGMQLNGAQLQQYNADGTTKVGTIEDYGNGFCITGETTAILMAKDGASLQVYEDTIHTEGYLELWHSAKPHNTSIDIGNSGAPFRNVYIVNLVLKETTTPTATSDFGKLYTKSDNKLYFQDGDGTEHTIAFA